MKKIVIVSDLESGVSCEPPNPDLRCMIDVNSGQGTNDSTIAAIINSLVRMKAGFINMLEM